MSACVEVNGPKVIVESLLLLSLFLGGDPVGVRDLIGVGGVTESFLLVDVWLIVRFLDDLLVYVSM